MDSTEWFFRLYYVFSRRLDISFYQNAADTIAEMHEPIGRKISIMRDVEVVFKKQVPFLVLLIGVDEREGDGGSSDPIAVMTGIPTVQ